MHDRKLGLGRQRLGIVAHGREITKAGLKPLGDRHLSGRAAQDDLAGEVDPLSGQGVDNIIPRPRLDRIERFRRLRATSAGNMGTMLRSATGRLAMARELTPDPSLLESQDCPQTDLT